MSTRLVNLVADAADAAASGRWWAAALGWEMTFEQPDEVAVEPPEPDGLGIPLVFVPVPDPKTTPNRVHLDLASPSAAAQTAQVAPPPRPRRHPGRHRPGPGPLDGPGRPRRQRVLRPGAPRPVHRHRPLAAVVMAATDPEALARFWAEAAAWPLVERRRALGRAPPSVGSRPVPGADQVGRPEADQEPPPPRPRPPPRRGSRHRGGPAPRPRRHPGRYRPGRGVLDGPGRPRGQRAVRALPPLIAPRAGTIRRPSSLWRSSQGRGRLPSVREGTAGPRRGHQPTSLSTHRSCGPRTSCPGERTPG